MRGIDRRARVRSPRRPSARAAARRRGSALVAALLVVGVVAVISVAYLQLSLSRGQELRGSVDAKRAFYIAEAGLAEAFLALSTGQSGNIANSILPARYANGLVWVEAIEGADGRVQLKSTGMAGTGRTSVSIVVEPVYDELGALGMFGADAVRVGAGSRIEGFDSRPAAMRSIGAPVPRARLGSNGDVVLDESKRGPATVVDGDVEPGPSGAVVRGANVSISGSLTPRAVSASFPRVVVPQLAMRDDVAPGARPGSRPVLAGDGAIRSVHVDSGMSLSIQGPAQLAIERFVVEAGGSVEIDSNGGAVELFVTEWLRFAPRSTLGTASRNATGVRIVATAANAVDQDGDGSVDPPVRIESSGDLYGVIYAPEAVVAWPASMKLHGAIAARELSIEAGSTLYFDAALLDAPSIGGSRGALLAGWRLVEVPITELTRLRIDPLLVLKLSGITPPRTQDAHYNRGVDPKAGVMPLRLVTPRSAR